MVVGALYIDTTISFHLQLYASALQTEWLLHHLRLHVQLTLQIPARAEKSYVRTVAPVAAKLSTVCIVCTHALSLQLRMVSNGVVLSLVSPLALVVSGVVTRCSIVA